MSCRGGLFSILVFIAFLPSLVSGESLPVPKIPYAPLHYVCYRTTKSLTIDGVLDESSWLKAAPTARFVDIEGNLKPLPRFETHAYMLWDSTYFYVGARLVEPDVWGTLTQRDAVIYHDNDFEVFIDPDGDTHEYYELELNALNTVWDLLLIRPYRDGGPAVNAWDIQGLKTAVHIDGTLNTPGDVDSGWSVEIAIPWKVLAECAHRPSPPNDGDQWRINFSRVEWQTEVIDGKYVKVLDLATGKSLPENNWVWSPQGLIAMHYPEMWGIVQFTTNQVGSTTVPFVPDFAETARRLLFQVYYAETDYRAVYGTFTSDWTALLLDVQMEGFVCPEQIEATPDMFRASAISIDGKTELSITQDGCLKRQDK
jgi:hypothetical protein